MAFACKYPENETLLIGDPVPPSTVLSIAVTREIAMR
jgi:hypothetical protein